MAACRQFGVLASVAAASWHTAHQRGAALTLAASPPPPAFDQAVVCFHQQRGSGAHSLLLDCSCAWHATAHDNLDKCVSTHAAQHCGSGSRQSDVLCWHTYLSLCDACHGMQGCGPADIIRVNTRLNTRVGVTHSATASSGLCMWRASDSFLSAKDESSLLLDLGCCH